MTTGFIHETQVSATVEWYTPQWIFDALGVTFDLDPCSPVLTETAVPARRRLTELDDGLTSEWHPDEFVWLNPPYGRKRILGWMTKMAEHNHGIALIPARTDAKWFQETAGPNRAYCFMSKRIRFISSITGEEATENPGFGSLLIGYGPRGTDAVKNAGLGPVMEMV